MNFFSDCTTIEEAKTRYRDLAKTHHPDKGGTTEIMQRINAAYTIAIAQIARAEKRTDSEINDILRENEKYRAAIDAIINIEGITIELVGCWVWVTGNTKPHRNILRAAGFFWASKKFAWYFRTAEYKCKSGKGQDLDEIRNKYGSKPIYNNGPTSYKIAS